MQGLAEESGVLGSKSAAGGLDIPEKAAQLSHYLARPSGEVLHQV